MEQAQEAQEIPQQAEEAHRIQAGDVVALKSGGPLMTVAQASAPHEIQCVWIAADGTPRAQMYSSIMLDYVPRVYADGTGE